MYKKYFKRPMDFVLAFLAIIILSPVLLIIAILVKIKLGSPILFIERRVGKNNKVFNIYKFRTMTNEKNINGELLSNEDRLTKFGRRIRNTSLDELPELINIIKGDMSIVGPRPLPIKYLPYYTVEERKRHTERSGLTGLAQINGRNRLSWEEKFKYDLKYVENITFIGDLKIIFITIKKVIKKEDIVNDETFIIGDYVSTSLDIERANSNKGEYTSE